MQNHTLEDVLLDIKITSALISAALNAAVVSVVKYGLPVPAPKITILPFSKCLTARLLMFGSADPKLDESAVKFDEISYSDVLAKDLKVMDQTAITLCKDNDIDLCVLICKKMVILPKLVMDKK